jgi:Zn-dependent protease with chaperone function
MLTDDHPQHVEAGGGGPARIEIRRALAARGPSDALRFEIVHEYAHFLEPDRWHGLALSPLVAGVGAAGLISWVAAVVGSSVVHSQRLLRVGLIVGSMLLGAALCVWVRLCHRRELRADFLAAELLGGVGPGLVWFDEIQARHQRLGRMARLGSLFTHPSPTRRRQALLNATRRGKDHRLAGGAVDLVGPLHEARRLSRRVHDPLEQTGCRNPTGGRDEHRGID